LAKGNNIWHDGVGSSHCNLRWATFSEQSLNRRELEPNWPHEPNWLEGEVFTAARVPQESDL
jgi:hypothetical protein